MTRCSEPSGEPFHLRAAKWALTPVLRGFTVIKSWQDRSLQRRRFHNIRSWPLKVKIILHELVGIATTIGCLGVWIIKLFGHPQRSW